MSSSSSSSVLPSTYASHTALGNLVPAGSIAIVATLCICRLVDKWLGKKLDLPDDSVVDPEENHGHSHGDSRTHQPQHPSARHNYGSNKTAQYLAELQAIENELNEDEKELMELTKEVDEHEQRYHQHAHGGTENRKNQGKTKSTKAMTTAPSVPSTSSSSSSTPTHNRSTPNMIRSLSNPSPSTNNPNPKKNPSSSKDTTTTVTGSSSSNEGYLKLFLNSSYSRTYIAARKSRKEKGL